VKVNVPERSLGTALGPSRAGSSLRHTDWEAWLTVGYPALSLLRGILPGGDCHGVWRSLVARFVRDEEAAGSNPVTPTRKTAGHGPSCVRLEAPWLESTAAKYSSWPCHQLERGAPARSVRGDRRPPLICSEQRLLADAGAGFSGSGARLPKGGTGVAIFVCGYFHRVRISSRLNAARAAKNRTTTRVARAPASVSIEPGLRMRIPISDET
jgi:hypothetical protein